MKRTKNEMKNKFLVINQKFRKQDLKNSDQMSGGMDHIPSIPLADRDPEKFVFQAFARCMPEIAAEPDSLLAR